MDIRSKILEAKDIREEVIEVPAWGVSVGVRGLSARQRADFARVVQTDTAKATVRAVIDCVFDPETGKPVFEQAHQDVLLQKSGAAIDDIARAILRLSGLDVETQKDLEKN